MRTGPVLLISTDVTVIARVRRVFSAMRRRLCLASSLEEATDRMADERFDVVLLQTDAPGTDIPRRFAEGFRLWRIPPVVAVAKSGSIGDAVRAVRAGARDYLLAQFLNSDAIRDALRRAAADARVGDVGSRRPAIEPYKGLITTDYRMLSVCETVAAVADSTATLLIAGESGTGKNLLARILHENSRRRDGPFLNVNCGGLSDSLLESELFGHVRGAFSSAHRDRLGKFEAADGGTVLLDEIANASVALQTRLLHAVESGRFEKVGDTRTIQSDVRLVVATNVSLGERVSQGLFREDLYHRLDALKVALPALRERVGDIPLLGRHFLRVLAEQCDRPVEDISPEAMRRLVNYPWPGNVRELRNVIEHAVVLARGRTILAENLPQRVARHEPGEFDCTKRHEPLSLKDALREPERRYILQALRLVGWNKQHAARELHISRSTLYKKIREHGLEDVEAGQGSLSLGTVAAG